METWSRDRESGDDVRVVLLLAVGAGTLERFSGSGDGLRVTGGAGVRILIRRQPVRSPVRQRPRALLARGRHGFA